MYVFPARDGGMLSAAGFRKQLARIAEAAGLGELRIHPHMLRHSAGQVLVDRMPLGMLADYLGHAQIQNTRIYSRANGERFRGIWRKGRKSRRSAPRPGLHLARGSGERRDAQSSLAPQ